MHGISDIIIYLSIGMYLCLFLYYIAVYFGRRSDRTNLHFSLLMLALAMFVINYGIIPKHSFIYAYPVYAFRFIANTLVGFFVIQFSYSIVGPAASKYSREMRLLLRTVLLGLLIALIISFFAPRHYFPIITALYLLPIGIWSVSFASRLTFTFFFSKEQPFREKWRLFIVIGMLVFIATLFSQMLMLFLKMPLSFGEVVLNGGAVFLSLISAFSLANRFNQEYRELLILKEDLEDKVKSRTKELEMANAQKTNAFINLAHEIKTPLTLINNSIKNLSQKVGETAELIEIKSNISQLLRDAVNFLDSEKLERGQIFYDNDKAIDLSEMLTRKIQSFITLAAKKQIKINHSISGHLYSKIDPFAFDRIVNNLIDNAIKYNRPLGTISVLLNATKEVVMFSVEDSGIGISDEDQKAIFDPYYQSSRAKRNVQGIGMGLYIVAQIVKSVRGSINVTSQLNSGSKFKIELKQYSLKEGEKILSTGSISEPINTPSEYDCSDIFNEKNKGTLLLVEDNLSLLHSLRSVFGGEYNVICSQNGEEALEKLEKYKDHKPDLVISDIMMDKMDGNAFYDVFHQEEDFKDIPFIFLTAKSIESENVEALTKGAIDYIYKPFSMEVLQAKVKSIIEFSKIKKMLFAKDKFHSLGILTASISHEILNPLSGIVGLLYVLEGAIKDQSNPEIDEAINFIKSNTSRINETVLTMRSLFNGDVLRLEKINAFRVLSPIIKVYTDKTKERIKFILNIPENVIFTTNSNALTQIMSNLLSNSIDSISNKGLITVSIDQKGNHTVLSISDTGSGIEAKYQQNIFELGFSKKDTGNGTGLGLYIVKELCANLNISISFESTFGKGTTFTLQFPD
jgi:signal transduction histidine kinase